MVQDSPAQLPPRSRNSKQWADRKFEETSAHRARLIQPRVSADYDSARWRERPVQRREQAAASAPVTPQNSTAHGQAWDAVPRFSTADSPVAETRAVLRRPSDELGRNYGLETGARATSVRPVSPTLIRRAVSLPTESDFHTSSPYFHTSYSAQDMKDSGSDSDCLCEQYHDNFFRSPAPTSPGVSQGHTRNSSLQESEASSDSVPGLPSVGDSCFGDFSGVKQGQASEIPWFAEAAATSQVLAGVTSTPTSNAASQYSQNRAGRGKDGREVLQEGPLLDSGKVMSRRLVESMKEQGSFQNLNPMQQKVRASDPDLMSSDRLSDTTIIKGQAHSRRQSETRSLLEMVNEAVPPSSTLLRRRASLPQKENTLSVSSRGRRTVHGDGFMPDYGFLYEARAMTSGKTARRPAASAPVTPSGHNECFQRKSGRSSSISGDPDLPFLVLPPSIYAGRKYEQRPDSRQNKQEPQTVLGSEDVTSTSYDFLYDARSILNAESAGRMPPSSIPPTPSSVKLRLSGTGSMEVFNRPDALGSESFTAPSSIQRAQSASPGGSQTGPVSTRYLNLPAEQPGESGYGLVHQLQAMNADRKHNASAPQTSSGLETGQVQGTRGSLSYKGCAENSGRRGDGYSQMHAGLGNLSAAFHHSSVKSEAKPRLLSVSYHPHERQTPNRLCDDFQQFCSQASKMSDGKGSCRQIRTLPVKSAASHGSLQGLASSVSPAAMMNSQDLLDYGIPCHERHPQDDRATPARHPAGDHRTSSLVTARSSGKSSYDPDARPLFVREADATPVQLSSQSPYDFVHGASPADSFHRTPMSLTVKPANSGSTTASRSNTGSLLRMVGVPQLPQTYEDLHDLQNRISPLPGRKSRPMPILQIDDPNSMEPVSSQEMES